MPFTLLVHRFTAIINSLYKERMLIVLLQLQDPNFLEQRDRLWF
jgi:hypothetical protein